MTAKPADPYVSALARLLAAYPGAIVAEHTQRLILEKLRAFPVERAVAGIENLIDRRGGTFFPSVPDVVGFIRAVPVQEVQAPEPERPKVKSGRFRGGVLKGETWTEDELQGPNGERNYENNNIVRRAAAAMEERIRERFYRQPDEPNWA